MTDAELHIALREVVAIGRRGGYDNDEIAEKLARVVRDLAAEDRPGQRRWSCDRCDWYTTEFLPLAGQAKRTTVAHVYELCRHYAACHPSPQRCPSCEHRPEFHQPEGCWYSVTDAKPGTTVGCNCIGWTP